MSRRRTGNHFAPPRGKPIPREMLCERTGKVRYREMATAERALAKAILYASRPPRRVYLCPHCNRWHLTSEERRDA